MDFKLRAGVFMGLVLGSVVYIGAMKPPKVVAQPASMSSAEIMEEMLKRAIEAEIGPEDSNSDDLEYSEDLESPVDLEYIDSLRKQYRKQFLSTMRQNFHEYELAGSIDYFMSLEEIKNKVKKRFKEMYKKGQIITEDEFQRRDKSKWHKVKGGDDLTRIWGAEYLAKKFAEGKLAGDKRAHLKVPDYLIVVSDLTDIQVGIDLLGSCFPIVNPLLNGTIYAEKIEGTPGSFPNVGYGFTDYTDPGNILRTDANTFYVVDTELKSFYDNCQFTYLLKKKRRKYNWTILCSYLKHRFDVLNAIDICQKYTVTFSVLD